MKPHPLGSVHDLFRTPDRSLFQQRPVSLAEHLHSYAFPLVCKMLSGLGATVSYVLPMRKLMLKEVKEFACSPLAGKLQRCFLSQGIHCQDKVKGQPLVSSIASPSFSSTEKETGFVSDSGKPGSLSAPWCFCW